MNGHTPKAQPGSAHVELISQWDVDEGLITRLPDDPAGPLSTNSCTWVHTRMPEVDAQGKRATRTDWASVGSCLRRFGLTPPGPEQQSALGAPLSDKAGVLAVLGASVVTAKDNRYGSRKVVRLGRISLVPVTDRLLISARHRDGLDWVEPVDGPAAAAMRESALSKRDPYRPTSLLASIDALGKVGPDTSAEELAIELVLAATQAYPRAVLDKLNRMLSKAEEQFAAFDPPNDLEADTQPQISTLLRLIVAVGGVEQELREVEEDFVRRTSGRGFETPRTRAVEVSLTRTFDALARIQGDARTTVDMIGSTLSSAHLQIARREARAASELRAQQSAEAQIRQEAEAAQREREQGLARTVALLTSVLLIPTLVASVFGANVKLPRTDSVWETWLMLACMIGLGSFAYAVLREFDPTRDRPNGLARIVPYVTAFVSLAAGTIIAFGMHLTLPDFLP